MYEDCFKHCNNPLSGSLYPPTKIGIKEHVIAKTLRGYIKNLDMKYLLLGVWKTEKVSKLGIIGNKPIYRITNYIYSVKIINY